MVIKKSFQTWAAALATAALAAGAYADTITLKDGTKIEGTVQSENEKEVVIEEKISASITDIRTVPKADIAKVDKTSEDAPAYQAIKELKPGANSLPAASYDQILRSLNNFVSSYPESTYAPEVKKQITAWEEEKKRVDEGEVKLGGNWLSKEDAQKERYQINGMVILNHMQQQYRQGDLVGALNSFDQLERNYPGARSYPQAVELAKQILPALKSSADRTLQQAKFKKAEREKGVALLSEPQRTQTLAAIQREEQQVNAAVEAANRASLKWPPLVPHETTLTTISNRVPEEQRRLAEIPVSKMQQSIKLAEEARGLLTEKKFDDADPKIREAIELWGVNEIATRLQNEAGTLRTASESATAAETATTTEEMPATEAVPAEVAAKEGTQNEVPVEEVTAEEETTDEDGESFFATTAGLVTLIILGIVVMTAVYALRKISKRAAEVQEE